MSREQMAEAADVSVKTIQQAKVAHAAGLGDQVRDGESLQAPSGRVSLMRMPLGMAWGLKIAVRAAQGPPLACFSV